MIDVTNTAAVERVIAEQPTGKEVELTEVSDGPDITEQLTEALRTSARILDYLVDPKIITKISKREREIVNKFLIDAYDLLNSMEM